MGILATKLVRISSPFQLAVCLALTGVKPGYEHCVGDWVCFGAVRKMYSLDFHNPSVYEYWIGVCIRMSRFLMSYLTPLIVERLASGRQQVSKHIDVRIRTNKNVKVFSHPLNCTVISCLSTFKRKHALRHQNPRG